MLASVTCFDIKKSVIMSLTIVLARIAYLTWLDGWYYMSYLCPYYHHHFFTAPFFIGFMNQFLYYTTLSNQGWQAGRYPDGVQNVFRSFSLGNGEWGHDRAGMNNIR